MPVLLDGPVLLDADVLLDAAPPDGPPVPSVILPSTVSVGVSTTVVTVGSGTNSITIDS